MRRAQRVALLVLLGATALAVNALSATVPGEQPIRGWVPDDSVNALASSGQSVFVGGFFSHFAARTGPFVVLSGENGSRDDSYPQVSGVASSSESANSPVATIVDDGSGGWFLGGSFRFAGETECPRLAHIRANQTVDRAFCLHPDGPVLALARTASTLYVAGRFTRIQDTARSNLAAVDLATGAVRSWRADVKGATFSDGHSDLDASVNALAVYGSTLYVGGFFDHVRGEPRRSVAAADTSTGSLRAWNPGLGRAPERVFTLATSRGVVYIGGSFAKVAGKSRSEAAAVDASSGRLTAWNPAPDDVVWHLAVSGARVYAAGAFTSIRGVRRRGLAALDPQSGSALAWNPAPQGAVDAIAPAGGVVYASGGFKRIGGKPRVGLAELDATGRATSWSAPAPHFEGCCFTIPALAIAGGEVAAGGHFASMGGVTRDGLAALSPRTGRPTRWHPRFVTEALAVAGDTLYAAYEGLAAIDISSGRTTWTRRVNPVTPDVGSGSIDALATDGSTVFVGGYFLSIGGKPRLSLAALDARTGEIKTWSPRVRGSLLGGMGEVRALALVGKTLYIGGDFETVEGKSRANLAAIDVSTGIVLPWNPRTDAEGFGVKALARRRGTLYIGGDFTKVDGQQHRGVAAVDIRSGAVRPWNPRMGGAADVEINAIAVAGDAVYIGGAFTSIGGRRHNNLAAVLVSSAQPLAWNPRVGQDVRALLVGPSVVYVGGGFESVGASPQRFLARFRLR